MDLIKTKNNESPKAKDGVKNNQSNRITSMIREVEIAIDRALVYLY